MIQEEEKRKPTADTRSAATPDGVRDSVPPSPDPRSGVVSDDEGEVSASDSKAAKAPEMSKRDKRRAREARKKAEEEERKAAAKEARKAAKKAQPAPPPAPSKKEREAPKFVQPKRKGDKGRGKKVEEKVVTPEDVQRAAEEVNSLRSKMVDKWAEHWTGLVDRLRAVYGDVAGLVVLCLGLGRPFGDRTAKIQLAFILELAAGLGATPSVIQAFDPVFEDADVQLLKSLGCEVMKENLVSC